LSACRHFGVEIVAELRKVTNWWSWFRGRDDVVFAPILRAGVTFAEGILDLVPAARVAHIGLYREPDSFVAVEYFFKAPSDLEERLVIVVALVIATANTAAAAIVRLKERRAKEIRALQKQQFEMIGHLAP
jgi:uracil phosphoribosyltransferase